MNSIDKLVMEYSDKMLDISESDMTHGDKAGCFMALSRQIMSDIAKNVAEQDLDLDNLII